MTRRILTHEDVEKAVYGGCILGGGGGGWISDGLERAETALKTGVIELITIDELADEDYVTCVSMVGAPSAEERYIDEGQFIDTVKRMQAEFDEPIKALMTNENGASGTVNGWIQAAATGLPLLDAPCNGRAHPTGTMGALNLSEQPDYVSIQTFAGGDGENRIAGIVKGTLTKTSSIVRRMSVEAGGMVLVCRNPVSIAYAKENAALGGITQAIELGEAFLSKPEGIERVHAVASFLGGEVLHTGEVTGFNLKKDGGFDVGLVQLENVELTYWNEYMTAEVGGVRKGTFPDLIMTFNAKSGEPVVTAEIELGMELAVINVPKENLKLSSTMFNQKLLASIEPIIQKKIL